MAKHSPTAAEEPRDPLGGLETVGCFNIGDFCLPVGFFDTLDLFVRHATAPDNLILPDPVMRTALETPVADRRR